jgi:hypothetical protein
MAKPLAAEVLALIPEVPDLPTHNPAMQVDTQAGDSVACEVSSTTES